MSKSKSARAESPMPYKPVWFMIALLALLIAVVTHSYLTSIHYALKFGQTVGSSLCNINELFSCEAASASRFSELFGLPIALWGAVTNLVLLVYACSRFFMTDDEVGSLRVRLLIFSGFIALVSIVMGAVSLLTLNQYCPFCILTYVLSFITFAGFYVGLPRGTAKPTVQSTLQPLAICGVAIVVLSFIFASGTSRKYSPDKREFDASIRSYVEEWKANPALDIKPVAPLKKGRSDGAVKMTVVEFADFRCGHCKTAAPVLNTFVKSRPDVELLFMTWPLDGECNSAISSSHGTSCALARAFICASEMDKGWPAHDWIFQNQSSFTSLDAVKQKIAEMANELKLEATRFNSCVDSEKTKETVRAQAELGIQLNLRGTPAVFVNGKFVPSGASLPVLNGIYESL